MFAFPRLLPVFSRLLIGLIASAPAHAATSLFSTPFGVIAENLPTGDSAVAFPLIEADVLAATLVGNTNKTLTFSPVNVGALLTPGRRYYIEIVTGPLEGERFDLNSAATLASANATATLDLGPSSFSTSSTLKAGALSGARAVIRPHVTLSSLQQTFSPALNGHNNFVLADGVKVFTGSAFTFYFLRGDGQTWRSVGGGTTDLRSTVIPPDVSLLVTLKSGARRWTHTGTVRTNAFRKKLSAGLQSFASGFPIDLAPVQLSAFVDGSLPAAVRWQGNNNLLVADTLLVFKRPASPAAYYLRGDGSSWWRVAGPSTNFATTPFVGATSMTLLRRIHADPSYLVPRPF